MTAATRGPVERGTQRLRADSMQAAEVATLLATDSVRGLSAREAALRSARDGPNALRSAPRTPAWRRMVSQFQDPLTGLLLVAIGIACAAWTLDGADGWPIDAVVIAVVVTLNAVLGFVQEAKAQTAVDALGRMTAVLSSIVRDGIVLRVPSIEIVSGDLLLLGEGDAVGADARLVDAASLRIVEASLTGESLPVLKDCAPLSGKTPLADRRGMVFKGTAVTQGTGRALVTAIGMNTEIGSIATLLAATADAPTPLQKEIAHVGRVLGAAVIVIAIVVVATIVVLAQIRTANAFVEVLLLGVSLAVAAVPEGLSAIMSLVLALGVQRMARHHAIVKKLSSVETLGSASVICTDKTGTLTRSEMTIERVATASGASEVTGVGYAPDGAVRPAGTAVADSSVDFENLLVLGGGSLAGNAALRQAANGDWTIQGDPTEAAFLVAESKLGSTATRTARYERVRELPFTSLRKMMSVIERDHDRNDAPVLFSKGAPDVLLRHCTQVQVGTAVVPLDAVNRARILSEVDTMSDAALRTLGVAYRALDAIEADHGDQSLESGLVYAGTVGMIDPPRAEAGAAIRRARRAGIRVVMITGDHPRTAARIAADLEIVEPGTPALTGTDLDALSDAGFAAAVRCNAVFARVAPSHKLRIVRALQADGSVVAMTGDGVNDAPALKAADIGVAMGMTGTEVTREAAKMILADDNFATIVEAVREGRGILDNIRKFLRYLLASNMGEVLTVFLGVVASGLLGLHRSDGLPALPLLATQLLWINLITDSAPALAMGIDPPAGDLMTRRPRGIDDRLIDRRMWAYVFQIGFVTAFVTLLTMDYYLPGGLIEGTSDLTTARTAGFTVLVLASLFTCFGARSDVTSAFANLLVNKWLWGAVVASAAMQVAVVHVGFLNVAFGTAPLAWEQWVMCCGMASLVLWYSEAVKLLVRFRRGMAAAAEHLSGVRVA
ncbi:MAG: cation-translocating P-type ATPase [Burkholderiaceae bacterium]